MKSFLLQDKHLPGELIHHGEIVIRATRFGRPWLSRFTDPGAHGLSRMGETGICGFLDEFGENDIPSPYRRTLFPYPPKAMDLQRALHEGAVKSRRAVAPRNLRSREVRTQPLITRQGEKMDRIRK